MSVLIVTSLGDIVIDLHTSRCPLTTKNFLKLCKIKYYNGCLFHTVQKDFNAQTGDPTGKGTGGDSIYKFLYGEQARFFGDEIHPDLKHSKTGTVSMANAGENLNASQFYFTLRDDLDYLDGKHTVFGEVAEGLETLTRINEAFVDDKGRPYKNIRIKHTYILDDPFDDPSQLAELIPDASPEGKPPDELEDVRLEDDWVPMEEQMDAAEIQESLQNKEAHSRAVLLEMIGDIPEAEIKPPENVLFVCKLNPVTQDSDLDVIFSRFGNVVSADIIRDYKTGDSLCYAFIEFETEEACEQAYFKMDNALIDDRRIHVDFSQSVSKLWSQYRRGGKRTQGKGCFKCGALDHIAKDCTGGADTKSEPQKYILKDNNAQHGDGHKSYEMVFDGNGSESSGHERKRHREQETEEKAKKSKTRGQGSDDSRHKDHERHRGSSDGHGQDDKSQQHREDERTRESSKSKQIGNRRDGYCMSEIREERAEKHDRDRGYQQRTVSDRHGRGEERDGNKSSSNEHSEGEERDIRKSRDYGMERRRDVSKRSRDEERGREEGRDGRKSQHHGRGEGRDGRKSQDHGRGEERDVNNRRRDDKHTGGDDREVRKSRDYGSVEERDGSKRSRHNEHGRGGVREIRKSGDHERVDDKHSRGDDRDVRKSRDHGRGGVREIRQSKDRERGDGEHSRGDDRDVRKSRDHGRVEEREGTKSRGDEYNRGDERDGGSSRGHDREHYSDKRYGDGRKWR